MRARSALSANDRDLPAKPVERASSATKRSSSARAAAAVRDRRTFRRPPRRPAVLRCAAGTSPWRARRARVRTTILDTTSRGRSPTRSRRCRCRHARRVESGIPSRRWRHPLRRGSPIRICHTRPSRPRTMGIGAPPSSATETSLPFVGTRVHLRPSGFVDRRPPGFDRPDAVAGTIPEVECVGEGGEVHRVPGSAADREIGDHRGLRGARSRRRDHPSSTRPARAAGATIRSKPRRGWP